MIKVLRVDAVNNVAVSVTITNGNIEIRFILDYQGGVIEAPHSRFREDGKQVRSSDDLDIPPADYSPMFRVAGAILGKPRRKKVPEQ